MTSPSECQYRTKQFRKCKECRFKTKDYYVMDAHLRSKHGLASQYWGRELPSDLWEMSY